MKKIVTVIIALFMCVSLVSCGKSEPVKQAENAIAAIGEVTIDSEETIKSAEKLYNILTDSEKEKVENRMTLIDAREAFDSLKEEALKKEDESKKKEIFDNAKKAFNKISEAEEICENGMHDVHKAWHFGIYDASDYDAFTVLTPLCQELRLTEKEVEAGLEAFAEAIGRNALYLKVDLTLDDAMSYCTNLIVFSYAARGDIDIIDNNLEEAKELLQKLTTEYQDYEYYPKLKDYYAKVSSYAEFFKSPSGSFDQLADTINDYENNIRTYRSDLEFLFK